MKKIVINACFGGFGLSEEAHQFLGPKYDEYVFGWEFDRTDPKLIECVEKLGAKASGRFAELVVKEIPDDFDFEIDDYDGAESIRLIPVLNVDKLLSMHTRQEIINYLNSMKVCCK